MSGRSGIRKWSLFIGSASHSLQRDLEIKPECVEKCGRYSIYYLPRQVLSVMQIYFLDCIHLWTSARVSTDKKPGQFCSVSPGGKNWAFSNHIWKSLGKIGHFQKIFTKCARLSSNTKFCVCFSAVVKHSFLHILALFLYPRHTKVVPKCTYFTKNYWST